MPEGLREDPYHWTELPSLNKDYYYYYYLLLLFNSTFFLFLSWCYFSSIFTEITSIQIQMDILLNTVPESVMLVVALKPVYINVFFP